MSLQKTEVSLRRTFIAGPKGAPCKESDDCQSILSPVDASVSVVCSFQENGANHFTEILQELLCSSAHSLLLWGDFSAQDTRKSAERGTS